MANDVIKLRILRGIYLELSGLALNAIICTLRRERQREILYRQTQRRGPSVDRGRDQSDVTISQKTLRGLSYRVK